MMFSKGFEKIIKIKIVDFLNNTNGLDKQQFGFRENSSFISNIGYF